MTTPSGGFAPENPDVPGEFNAQPGYNARQEGLGATDSRYPDVQRGYGAKEAYGPSKLMRAAYITDPTDPNASADPSALGS